MTTTLTRGLTACFAILITLIGTLVAATPASSTSAVPVASLTNIRTGLNSGFDRIVLDLTDGPRPDVSHTWVDELIQDPTGEIFWLTGEHFLNVVSTPARAFDDNYTKTYLGPEKFRTRNLRNVMAVGLTGDFEAHLSIGIGTRYQSWVRVFVLTAPHRIVIDVGS
ncbi:MAG TPA: hypothetical protein VGX25_08250 [Actinophytocola sp.]|uniref:AMIN-like domain-containing (lipo)protein n=1 Tax=Actinophytocola sp. TaxID=1872138 RepID=UPI002DDD36B4|nr:hypothetical protein [Actinophytocola sp.]HEV2779379.1 hypothetical protein [Actinophytocola sp.]